MIPGYTASAVVVVPLARVVERIEEYIGTAAARSGRGGEGWPWSTALLVRAMKQESAHGELVLAVVAVQQKITQLKRG